MDEWHQFFVEGPAQALRALLAHLELASADDSRLILASDLPVVPASLGERLRELIGSGAHHLVLANRKGAERLLAAMPEHGERAGLRVRGQALLREARFDFRATAYSAEAAGAIRRALLADLPAGVALSSLREGEERDPSARGDELYTPAHAFTYRVEGTAGGDVAGVVELYWRASAVEQVEAGPLRFIPAVGRRSR